MMEFKIVDGTALDYESAKKAYLNGVRGNKLRKMFNIGTSQYRTLLNRFREDGITIPKKGKVDINNSPRYYHKHLCKGKTYWTVTRTVNWKKVYFGHYKTEAEAKARVKQLEKNNWEGLIKC